MGAARAVFAEASVRLRSREVGQSATGRMRGPCCAYVPVGGARLALAMAGLDLARRDPEGFKAPRVPTPSSRRLRKFGAAGRHGAA